MRGQNVVATVENYLTIPEAGVVLRVSRWTIHRLLRAGQLRRTKVGRLTRIPARDVQKYLDRNTRGRAP
jgi:excisionase family DNA binding protein